MGDIRPRMCQHLVVPGTKALTYGFHPSQNRGRFVKQYENQPFLMSNIGLHRTIYISIVGCFGKAALAGHSVTMGTSDLFP